MKTPAELSNKENICPRLRSYLCKTFCKTHNILLITSVKGKFLNIKTGSGWNCHLLSELIPAGSPGHSFNTDWKLNKKDSPVSSARWLRLWWTWQNTGSDTPGQKRIHFTPSPHKKKTKKNWPIPSTHQRRSRVAVGEFKVNLQALITIRPNITSVSVMDGLIK